jgi:hypothetical protein
VEENESARRFLAGNQPTPISGFAEIFAQAAPKRFVKS